jgi:branched-subunit amino acid aminotransferase/4-amino-4-deoxychorismate lyase
MGHDTRQERTRAFLYGESVFTTMRVENGRIFFADAHQKRLFESAEWLWPGTVSQVERLWSSLIPPGESGTWRITLTAQTTSRQLRLVEPPELLLDDWWTPELPAPQNWKARTVRAAARPSEWPAFLKTGDYLARLVAARKVAVDEIPLFHVKEKICEFMHANVFFWDSRGFHTPSLGPDVLAGLGRARFVAMLQSAKIPLTEREISLEELTTFKSTLAVNAVRGLISVDRIDEREGLRHPLLATWQRTFFET